VAAGAPREVLQYHHDPRNESFGEEAAQVFKTLVLALPEGSRSGSGRA
jgi:Cys-tRNA(Pro)/Cys-tRNA(Cys) deacylase